MRTKKNASLPLALSNILGAVTVFIFPGLMLFSACDRVPEPTASTNANTVSPDQESEQTTSAQTTTERETVNPEDPNLQDATGSESGVTSEPSDSAEVVEDQFRPPSSDARPKASPANPAKVE